MASPPATVGGAASAAQPHAERRPALHGRQRRAARESPRSARARIDKRGVHAQASATPQARRTESGPHNHRGDDRMTSRRTGHPAPHRRPGLAAAPPALALPSLLRAQAAPVRVGYAIARTGPWTGGAQVSQEPNYLLWAEQQNAAGGLNVKGAKRPIELISSRRPQRHRDLRAHLREADGQRQGRPGAAALGQQRQLRGRAAGQPLRLPVPGADRAVRAA